MKTRDIHIRDKYNTSQIHVSACYDDETMHEAYIEIISYNKNDVEGPVITEVTIEPHDFLFLINSIKHLL